MTVHPFVYSCGLVGYVYNYVSSSGYDKISKEIWEEMLHGSGSSITRALRNFQWNHCLFRLFCRFIGVLLVCMVLALVVFDDVGLIIFCFHGSGS